MSVIIESIPCFDTNYVWLIYDEVHKNAVVVDPGDVVPVLQVLEEKQLSLKTILITHFHNDHIGGIAELKSNFKCEVCAPEKEAAHIPNVDRFLCEGDSVSLGNIGVAQVLETPGHTLGSICYYIPDLKAVFTGDTLFSLGCGRLFEGSPAMMYQSLNRLATLPDDTMIYCAHEYTSDNGRFATSVLPNYQPLKNRLEIVKQLRQDNLPTLPVSLGEEKKTNPFLLAKNVIEFTDYRKAKDHFS